MNELFIAYLEDFKDSLLLFNETLIKLQKGDRGSEVVNSIFRVAHTIKGNSAAVEFYNIEKVMHNVEDILSEIREGKRNMTEEVIELLFACHDFLEDSVDVIESTESDKSIDISRMLTHVERVRNTNESASSKENVKAKGKTKSKEKSNTDKNLRQIHLPPVDMDLVNVTIQNIKNGHQAYCLSIVFASTCQMKNVRAWMIFEKIDKLSTFVFSWPNRVDEEEFKNGEFEISGEKIDIYVISKEDIEPLKKEILLTSDIQSVDVYQLDEAWFEKEKARMQYDQKVFELLKDVEVNLMDMEKREIDLEMLKSVEISLGDLLEQGNQVFDEYVVDLVTQVLELVKNIEENHKNIGTGDIETIAYLVHKIQNFIEDPESINNIELKLEVEDILKSSNNKFMGSKSKIGEILSEKNVIDSKDVDDILVKQKEKYPNLKFGQVAVKEDKASAYEMMKAIKEQPIQKDVIKENTFIRVPTGKVDGLMDMLGELLILNAQMEQKVADLNTVDMALNNVLGRSAKLIRGIQGLSMSLRMVEIKPTLHRLTRIARDTATELNKKITVDIEGEETEIDRSASEKLFDPLMHLVRNAVSHGIEAEDLRVQRGKPKEGKVSLKVYSKRGSVYIEVQDDGNGISTERVLAKAKDQGLVIEGKDYTEDEIIRFIFHPGFSTQEVVNNISGRGVGMNVVESEVNKMGGKVEIINRPKQGSTFVVRIPMNLAVVNGTIVEVANGRYILPTLFIKEFFIPKKENWVSMQGKHKAIKVRDNIIPILAEKDLFGGLQSTKPLEEKNVIILELEQKYLAFPVDRIVARQEIVSKPLEKEFSHIGFASGASILGDGKVSIILDVEAMFKFTHK